MLPLLVISQTLLDAADPVEAVGILRIERERLLEARERPLDIVDFELRLAELMMQRGVLRPFCNQFLEQRLGDRKLLRVFGIVL